MWIALTILLLGTASLTSAQDVNAGGSYGASGSAKKASFLGIPLSNLKFSSAGFSNLHASGLGADLLGVHKAEGVKDLTPEEQAAEAEKQKQREEEFMQRNAAIQQQFNGGGAPQGGGFGGPPQGGFGGPPQGGFGGPPQGFGAPGGYGAPGFGGPGFGGPGFGR